MPEILTPRLELLGRLAHRLAEADERAAQAVRVEVRQTRRRERLAEDRPDGCGAAPVRSLQAGDLELASRTNDDVRRREERVIRRESLRYGRRDYVFTDSLGRPLSQELLAKRVWNPTIAAIGLSARGQYNVRDTFITLALSAGEDPGWVAQVCGTSEQMILQHSRHGMPSLRHRHGQRMVATLDLGPEIGPETANGPAISKDPGPLEEWRRGELNPRPEAIHNSVYVRSQVI